jgi:hypothetical protein
MDFKHRTPSFPNTTASEDKTALPEYWALSYQLDQPIYHLAQQVGID